LGLLIDSTIFVYAERRGRTPEPLAADPVERFGDVELAISVMTAGELFHGCRRADSPSRRARREEFVEAILAAMPSVPITLPSCESTARSTPGSVPRGGESPRTTC
jgi:predicted nucleic acid-binding protein